MDVEVDAHIEGSLAAESSLIVLDIMELLMQTISAMENLRSTLGRVSERSSCCLNTLKAPPNILCTCMPN